MTTTLGRYQLVRPIGKGGMAEVFAARLTGIGGFERDVAVKLLLPEFSSEPEFVEMLLDEARIAGAVNHPCVVQMLDVGREDDRFYLVMELVDGADLRSSLRKSPHHKLSVPAALYILAEVLRGLHAVHAAVDGGGVPRRIVHRDVSPANVLISRGGVVKLGDFGIAHARSRLTLTRNGSIKGKLKYMAPEQLTPGMPVDHRADLYAVGVMLCEILVGDAACEPRRITSYGASFAWSPRLAEWLPRDVAQIAERALAEDPARRFSDAAQFRQALVAALARRNPGYADDELARELAQLDDGFLNEMPTLTSEAIELHTEAGGETAPQLDGVTAPTPKWNGRKLVWAAGAAGVAALAVATLLTIGASSAARPPSFAALPEVAELRPVAPSTGLLVIDGPPGMSVTIGATVYPAGRLELPPGEYQVALRRRAHGRAVVRRVTIATGAVTPIKL